MKKFSDTYHPISIVLHWLLAICILAQLYLGFWMEGVPKSPPGVRASWFNLHKSTGMLIALIVLIRLIWRLKHSPPDWPLHMKSWQIHLARLNHILLYLCMVVMPVTGFLGSSFTPYPIKFFGVILPRWFEPDAQLKEGITDIHFAAAYLFVTIILLHILAAVFHMIKKDGIGRRMWIRIRPPIASIKE
jgi:cytochrome b561